MKELEPGSGVPSSCLTHFRPDRRLNFNPPWSVTGLHGHTVNFRGVLNYEAPQRCDDQLLP